MQFEGVYTPVITPFNEDSSINNDAYAVVIEHLIAQGTHGIVIGGTTGESYAMTKEERIAQFQYAHHRSHGRVVHHQPV